MKTERHTTNPPPIPPDTIRGEHTPPPLPLDLESPSTKTETATESSTERRKKTQSTATSDTKTSSEIVDMKTFEKEKEQILIALGTFEVQVNGEKSKEKLKQALLDVMKALHHTMHEVDLTSKEEERLHNFSFNVLGELIKKRDNSEQDIQAIFNDIFRDFSDVIDHGYLSQTTFSGQSIEDMVHEIYGRTQEEVETLKQHNRGQVVAQIEAFANKPEFSRDMLLSLYRTNNKDVIPDSLARFRDTESVNVSMFGRAKRIGLLPGEQVRREMKLFEGRVNDLIKKRALGMSEVSYQIHVAKLHDELLDMHPFADRNGSTSLLFAELMMAREGYTPSPERNTNYYDHVAKIFKRNYVAVGVVGYQHYLTNFVPGYYKPAIKTEEEAKIMGKVMEKTEQFRPKRLKDKIAGWFKKAA